MASNEQELYGIAAMLANLEGIGSGENQATLEELQSLGTAMLDLLDAVSA